MEEFENKKLLKIMILTKNKRKKIEEKVKVKVKVGEKALVKAEKSRQKTAITAPQKKTRFLP